MDNQIKINQKDLYTALGMLNHVIPSRTTMDILKNVLIETAGEDRVFITGTDLRVMIKVSLKAVVSGVFQWALPANLLTSIVGTLSGEITMRLSIKNNVMLMVDKFESLLPTASAEDYPNTNIFGRELNGIVMDGADLFDMIKRVEFAALEVEERPILNSINFDFNGNMLSLVATDGIRLAVAMKMGERHDTKSFLIPVDAVRVLARAIVMAKAENVKVGYIPDAEGRLYFDCGDVQVATLLVSGKYPNYMGIIPGGFITRVVFNREALMKACNQATIVARESDKAGAFWIRKNIATIDVESRGAGEMRIMLDCNQTGDDITILLHVPNLKEAIGVFRSQEVAFEFNGEKKPVIIRGLGKEDENYFYVTTPMSRGK